MTATNHTVTGALLATLLPNPLFVLPIAILSHFALDGLPHFGYKAKLNAPSFSYMLAADFGIASAFLMYLLLLQPDHWPLLVIAGICAASPDLMWFPKYLRALLNKPDKPLNKIQKFHSWIQWSQHPWGISVEIAWFVSAFMVFLTLNSQV